MKKCMVVVSVAIAILAVACMVFSTFDSVRFHSFNGWSMEGSSGVKDFYEKFFLIFGLLEIVLLLFQRTATRVFGILICLIKLGYPWLDFWFQNWFGTMMSDSSFGLSIINELPYIITGLCAAALLLNIILMVLHIIADKNTRKKIEQRKEKGGTNRLFIMDQPPGSDPTTDFPD